MAKYAGSPPEWSWRLRILKAKVLAFQSAYQEALDLVRGDLPPSLLQTDIGVRKNVVEGVAYRVAQDFDKSAAKFAAAEDLATRFQPQLLCEVLNARGALESSQKKFTESQTTYSRALAQATALQRSDQQGMALVSLAWVSMNLGHFDEAIARGQSALEFSRKLDMQGYVATALGNLGWSYLELGDFDNSLDYYKQAADLSDRLGLPGYKLYWLAGVSNASRELHDYVSAENLSKRTLELARELKNIQTITQCLNDLTRVCLRTGRPDLARTYNLEALAKDDHFGREEAQLLSAYVEMDQKKFAQAEQLFLGISQDQAAEAPLRWEAQSGLAGLFDSQGRYQEAELQYAAAIKTIERERTSINHDELRLSFLSTGIAVYGDYIDFLVRHHRPDDALRQADLSRARTLAEGLSAQRIATPPSAPGSDPRQIAWRLRSTLLVYWLGEKHSYLWAINPAKTQCLTLPPASEIDPLVRSYRDLTLKSSDLLADASDAGKKLYSTLVAPARKLVPANSRVILLPDASLYGLNFETLIVPDPQPHFWIEDVTVTTASSLSMLASASNRPPSKHNSLLVVGDAVPVPEFGPLPQARVEIQKIQPYFPAAGRTLLQGPQATPSAYLKSQPGRFSYLHFVTHGTASRARPLESAVILSKESDSDAYKLYARDIVAHPLQAELVTISACNGSGTRAYSGEGLVGLSWAFLRAGAHNVIGALWEVSDVSTPQLMDKLYAELAAGKDPATALRNAKLAFLHSHTVFSKPFYWAPFQLYSGS